jgi:ubiquinone/menaquinone biosynthesis C-methylase UbiE
MSDVRAVDHDGLVRVLFGASAFHLLRAGCELKLFDVLHEKGSLSEEHLGELLDLRPRAIQILLLGTTSLGLTVRDGGRFANAGLVDGMVSEGTWEIIEDIVDFEARIALPAAGDLVESLRQNTNVGLERITGEGPDLYHRLAAHPELEALFYRCMRSWSRLSNPVLVGRADLSGVRRVLDVGGGDGVNAIALAQANPGVSFTVMDMPGALKFAGKKIRDNDLESRIQVQAADIFADDYPRGHDCVLFANQLVIWSPEQNFHLLKKAYRCLPDGGQVLIFNAFSSDSGDGPLYAALDNVYFATLPAANSTIYPWGHHERWLADAGFRGAERLPGETWTPHGVLRAWK